MEFRLTYEGKLPSTRSKSDNRDPKWKIKHDIRRHFHKQLKNYWTENQVLSTILTHHLSSPPHPPIYDPMLIKAKNFNWLPLVVEQNNIECKLDILYLRNGARGDVISKSDIDNRVKTLLDALKAPSPGEISSDAMPLDGEEPFFVLLEDDKVVSHMSVETDMLLCPSADNGADTSTDSRVIIKVTVKPTLHQWMWDITSVAARRKANPLK